MDIPPAHVDPQTLTKAVLRSADLLGLQVDLAAILGVDDRRLMRAREGTEAFSPDRDEWQAATRFAGLFRSLLTLLGNAANASQWLDAPHRTLGATPRELLRDAAGRQRVFDYLDAVQKYEIKLPPRSQ